ncbi:MAG TPA: Bcr/CflA family drug resistance efflux transporter [Balneolaceae bacterium]|nr:Bcr/CflA family drug resistance efflux transporter [Balneolaceae bacterium]|tara:strand:+ start:290738 stop:291937 length:1200 start_codon:yes stop_codon:yes gene_type:complete
MTSTIHQKEHNRGLIVGLLGILTAFGPLSIDMYLPSLPHIAEDLNTSLGSVQFSLSAFFIGLASAQLLYGPFTDRVGRKVPLYVGMTIYFISSLVCAFAPNIETLIIARVFQALGSSAGVVVTRAIVSDLYDHREAARIYSVLILIMGAAPILAPLLGGQIAITLGWRYIFIILAAISLICLIGIIFLLTETHVKPDHPNRKILRTYRNILTHRKFLRNTFAGGIVQSGLFAYVTGSSYVFIELFDVPPEHFGYVFGTNAFGLILFSQINGRILKSRNPDQVLKVVFPAVAIIGLIVIIAGFLATELYQIWIPIFFFMSCLGMTFPNTTAEALSEERANSGSASALMGTIQYGLGASISAVMSLFHTDSALPMALVMGATAFIGASVYFFGKKPILNPR